MKGFSHMNYIELFKKTVNSQPEMTAIVDFEGARKTTYEKLDELSGRVGGKLHSMGCNKGNFIIVNMGRKMEYVAAYLGVLKAGCAVVPVVPEYPKQRIEFIGNNCGASVTITEEFFSDIDSYDIYENPAEDAEPGNIIYTSGSTGTPKGILHSAADIARAARRQQNMFTDIKPIVFGAACPLSFAAHFFEILSTMSLGAEVHILSERIRKSADKIARYYAKHDITAGTVLPQLLRFFKSRSGSLQRLVTGAERVSNIYSPDYDIINMYGMSEVAGVYSLFHIDRAYENTPVGRALEDSGAVIACDADGKELEQGETGELCFVDEFDTCYFNDPDRTAKTMIKLPDGKTSIHSGDMGYINENGDAIYVNRKDWMVKINGQRVDTLEVEAVLNDIDGIDNSVVKAFTDTDGQTYLTGYYTGLKDIKRDKIKGYLDKKLPYYMIPRYFVHLDAMPLNANGKLDRNSLQPPVSGEFKAEYVPPENDTEKAICIGFENVLHCGITGVNDDFFALGGDSIKVLKLVNEVSLADLTTDKILAGKTPRGIAALCSSDNGYNVEHMLEIPEISPLTDAQRGVYLECMEKPESTMYNIPMLCRLPEGTDITRFAKAIKEAASKHPVLNITVSAPDGEPVMLHRDREIQIEERKADNLEKECVEFVRPFDLEKGPLYRFEILRHEKGTAFLFDVHHIAFDGTSAENFISQIADAYNGEDVSAEMLNIFDIAHSEEELKQSDKYRDALKYFTDKLEGFDFDSKPFPDQVMDEYIPGAGTVDIKVNDLSHDAVSSFTRKHRISENTLFLGAFAYALAKYNGMNDSYFCTVNNGRHDPRLSSSVGMFVKTLPLHYAIDDSRTVAGFLPEVQTDFYESMSHDCVSFGDLVAECGVTTDVMFIYQAEMFNGADVGEGTVTLQPLETGECQTEMDFMLIKETEGYRLLTHYQKNNYTEAFIAGLGNVFLQVIRGMMECETLGEIGIITEDDVKFIDSLNDTDVNWNREETVISIFRKQVEKTPDNICLVCGDKNYTYRQVDDLTDRFAAYLVELGMEREKVAGILIGRTEHMLLSTLSVLKTGGAYMPLDPTYPQERLNLMMEDSSASLLIVQEEMSSFITDDFKGARINPDVIFELDPCTIELPEPSPEDLFVVLYTSGSTGKPKGVLFEHSNIHVTAEWQKQYYELDESSHTTAYASFGFDAHAYDLYSPIISGSQLHIIPEELRLDFAALKEYFNDNKITHTTMTTQVGRQFYQMPDLKYLKHLTVGGEKIILSELNENVTMDNAYGPSEGSIITSVLPIKKKYRDIPIGGRVDNIKIYVVDSHQRILPPGAVGELWLSGPHVTRGYLNRPEKMAEAYGENPFSDNPEYSRVYRTGDIVRQMHDGNLQFIGRRDGQVKVRGFRIELGEIEDVILRFPEVRDATVVAFDDKAGVKFVAAYVVSDEEVDTVALADFIASEKPPYMVPAVIMQIAEIPLTQNQKVNKRALPVPERNMGEMLPPENETQEKIFELAAEAMGHREFGITSDLYYAGLTSISAIKLNVSLAEAFNVPIKIADIRVNSTVQKLEALIRNSAPSESFEILDDYPITETQRGIFIETMAAPDTTVYNIPVYLKLGGGVDMDRLQQALTDAINAHPYVKTRLFTDESGDIRARRNDDEPVEIQVVNTEHKPDFVSVVRPFNLLKESLYRIKIYVTEEGNYLLMDFHHIICDGTSEAILFRDIDRAYMGETLEKEKYSGFEAALEEEKVRQSDAYAKAKEYWSKLLTGCETASLPKKDSFKTETGVAAYERIDQSGAEQIDEYCRKHGVTMNAFFNSVFAYVIMLFSGKEEVSFAGIYNGRNDSRIAQSVTMAVRTIPVTASFTEDINIAELVNNMQDQLLGSMSNDACSFAELSTEYGVNSDIIFAYQGDNFNFDKLCGEAFEMDEVVLNGAKAPVSLNVYLEDSKLRYSAEYRTDYFTEDLISSLVDSVITAAAAFAEKDFIKDISLMSPQALKTYELMNSTDVELESRYFHQFFERIAAETPDRMAAYTLNDSITYGELNRKANMAASRLIELGVTRDTIVGVILDRGINVLITELAIAKAGGAFLPMLPTYPDERINFSLSDSESPFVITTEDIRVSKPHIFGIDQSYETLTVEKLLEEGAQLYPDGNSDKNPDVQIDSQQLVLCIYTSGSTGKPKGVMLEHGNMSNYVQGNWIVYEKGRNNGLRDLVTLSMASISFDMSMADTYMPLFCGSTVYIASEDEIHNPMALRTAMMKHEIGNICCTPSFINNLISIPEMSEPLSGLQALMVGAEAFPRDLYGAMKSLNKDLLLLNGYGPTEAMACCTIKEVTQGDGVTIGQPISNDKCFVMDKYGNVLPPYAAGELIIAGQSVGRGYIHPTEKNRHSFFTMENMRAYHTGDAVRLTGKGELEFSGRIDNQVKLRGFRIELDEVENVMCSFEAVKQSKVIVRNNGTEDYLAGYFTADSQVDINELTEHMKSKLTYYMVPAAIMQLEQMPLTPNGKIDKKNLPEIQRTAAARPKKRAPKKSLEQRLCEIYSDLLHVEEIYADDDFFEMGGTSLTASKVTMILMSENIEIEYGDIFSNPTPEKLAAFIEKSRGIASDTKTEGISVEKKEIREALKWNEPKYANEVERKPLGNVVLTGASGFLGIHVLKELLETEEGHIWCLVRKGGFDSSEERLQSLMFYYFDEGLTEEHKNRITFFESDITDNSLGQVLEDIDFDTLINCAACVKHFTNDDILERVNVHGVENLIEICIKKKAMLVQTSTISVPGIHTAETYEKGIKMHENELFVIDDMKNKYGISKYQAELRILDAIESDGLRAKIVRVGNLMGRYSDGEFQINNESNMFLSGIRGFALMGKYPISHMTDPMSFSPIDCTAKAVVLLAGTNDKFTAFNADSRYGFDQMKLIDACNRNGIEILPEDDDVYYAEFNKRLGDNAVNDKLTALAAYDIPDAHVVQTDNLFTTNILYRIGFAWPLIDETYLDRVISGIESLAYFDMD